MKNNAHIFVLFIVVFLISCSSDDDTNEITETPILLDTQLHGVWRYESITITPETDYNNDGVTSTNFLVEMPFSLKDDVFILNSDATYSIIDSGLTCDNDERGFPLTTGIYDTGVFPVSNLRLEIKEPQNAFLPNFSLQDMKVLADSNTPDKRYLKFTINNENVLGLGEAPFGKDTVVTVILVADK